MSDLTESIRRSHIQYENANDIKDDFCADCVEEWPCQAIEAADRIDQLHAERDAWQEYAKAKDGLLACYRVQSHPSERLMKRLDRCRQVIESLAGGSS